MITTRTSNNLSKINIECEKNVKICDKITLEEFVTNFVDRNSIIRIWQSTDTSAFYLLRRKSLMAHEIHDSVYKDMMFVKVFGTLDKDCKHADSVNLAIDYDHNKFHKSKSFLTGLEYWKDIDRILHDMEFNLVNIIDDSNHCYYKNDFDGWVECDTDNQTIEVIRYIHGEPVSLSLETMEHVNEKWLISNLDNVENINQN